jgi:hypothetical protein
MIFKRDGMSVTGLNDYKGRYDNEAFAEIQIGL